MTHPETVKIVADVTDENPHGYIVINKDDLVEGQEIYSESETDAETARKAARAAMFAFLREKGVSVAKNSTDDALKAKVEEVKAALE